METDEDVFKRYTSFKKFDIAMDPSNHRFVKVCAPTKEYGEEWFANIKKELKNLEEHLPDGVFVRVYESRVDLLSFVIIGPKDTPYHDGLFFFDVCFGKGYPNSMPYLHYRSYGLSIHPNINCYGCVTLVLPRSSERMWVPRTSNILQLIIHLQNRFNKEPLLDDIIYNDDWDDHNYSASRMYNENTLVKSLKTMGYIMEKPPKNFVDLVVGHFRNNASDILMGVGYFIVGIKGKETWSLTFKDDLDSCIKPLTAAFKKIGVNNTEDILTRSMDYMASIHW